MVEGLRKGKNDKPLLYDVKAKYLYYLKNERNGMKIYECYQSVLSKRKKKKANIDTRKCTARVRVTDDGRCETMYTCHTDHNNHEAIKRTAVKKRNMVIKCETLRDDFGEDANKIPVRNIFQREIAK